MHGTQNGAPSAPFDSVVDFGVLKLKNPVLTASGTFGYAQEIAGLTDLSALAGVATKGISPAPRAGNPPPRICETASGMINSIGLENVGCDAFLAEKLPFLAKLGGSVWINFFGSDFAGYVECATRLAAGIEQFAGASAAAIGTGSGIDVLEMNISCPNVHAGGLEFGTDPQVARKLVRACKDAIDAQRSGLKLVVKLTPNITDVVALAKAVADGGADGFSLINTISAMAIDARRKVPRIATVFGGLSGPAIKPVALRMVHQVHRAQIGLPICGIGGIASGEDVAEFMLAGATCVQVGTLSFAEPNAAARIVREFELFCRETGTSSARELVGALISNRAPPSCVSPTTSSATGHTP